MLVQIEIKDSDCKCLANDITNIQRWVAQAVVGKVSQCKKRMLAQWIPKLLADPAVKQLPATEDEIIRLIISRPDYQNREQRGN